MTRDTEPVEPVTYHELRDHYRDAIDGEGGDDR